MDLRKGTTLLTTRISCELYQREGVPAWQYYDFSCLGYRCSYTAPMPVPGWGGPWLSQTSDFGHSSAVMSGMCYPMVAGGGNAGHVSERPYCLPGSYDRESCSR